MFGGNARDLDEDVSSCISIALRAGIQSSGVTSDEDVTGVQNGAGRVLVTVAQLLCNEILGV
jgi:hypothetical protein